MAIATIVQFFVELLAGYRNDSHVLRVSNAINFLVFSK
jgi:hypothetical protein